MVSTTSTQFPFRGSLCCIPESTRKTIVAVSSEVPIDVSFNDLDPDDKLRQSQIDAIRARIPEENASFVLQSELKYFSDDPNAINKNYRNLCLNTKFTNRPETYEQARAVLKGEEVKLSTGETINYQTMGMTLDDIKETRICQPKITGEPLDAGCVDHPNDL